MASQQQDVVGGAQAAGGDSSAPDSHAIERPYPFCLLCLVRPPTAVLLPCCHLNLCHVCAPLLIMKHRASAGTSTPISISHPVPIPTAIEEESDDQASSVGSSSSTLSTRAPWRAVLARATANHSKARRLSMGGYIPPDIGSRGGEMTGEDVACPVPERTRFTSQRQDDARVTLAGVETDTAAPAQCLMCRASVQGWLRVYVG